MEDQRRGSRVGARTLSFTCSLGDVEVLTAQCMVDFVQILARKFLVLKDHFDSLFDSGCNV